MYWKLRIPLFLLVLGIGSGLYQKFPHLFFVDTNYFIRSIIFLGSIGIIFTILEKTNINEKKVHFLIAILLILIGVSFDSIMV